MYEIIANIDRLQADAKRISDALRGHYVKIPVSSLDYATLHRLHRSVADFRNAMSEGVLAWRKRSKE